MQAHTGFVEMNDALLNGENNSNYENVRHIRGVIWAGSCQEVLRVPRVEFN